MSADALVRALADAAPAGHTTAGRPRRRWGSRGLRVSPAAVALLGAHVPPGAGHWLLPPRPHEPVGTWAYRAVVYAAWCAREHGGLAGVADVPELLLPGHVRPYHVGHRPEWHVGPGPWADCVWRRVPGVMGRGHWCVMVCDGQAEHVVWAGRVGVGSVSRRRRWLPGHAQALAAADAVLAALAAGTRDPGSLGRVAAAAAGRPAVPPEAYAARTGHMLCRVATGDGWVISRA